MEDGDDADGDGNGLVDYRLRTHVFMFPRAYANEGVCRSIRPRRKPTGIELDRICSLYTDSWLLTCG